MIEVVFQEGSYMIKDGDKKLFHYPNLYKALVKASKISKNNTFKISCNIPDDEGLIKSYYKCPECGGATNLNDSMKLFGEEEVGKQEVVRCEYCEIDYLVLWMQENFKKDEVIPGFE